MSLEALTWVWKHSPYRGGALLVHLALADYAGEHGESWPSVETLANKARLSERRTQEILKEMDDDGIIERDMNTGRGNTNRYRLTGKGAKTSPFPDDPEPEKGEVSDTKGDASRAERVMPTAPRTISEPLEEPSTTGTGEVDEPDPDPIEAAFEEFKAHYPKRAGRQGWAEAKRRFHARVKDGTDPAEIIDAVKRYHRFCEVTGKLGQETTMQAQTFVGPRYFDEHMENSWAPPPEKKKPWELDPDSEAARVKRNGNELPRSNGARSADHDNDVLLIQRWQNVFPDRAKALFDEVKEATAEVRAEMEEGRATDYLRDEYRKRALPKAREAAMSPRAGRE